MTPTTPVTEALPRQCVSPQVRRCIAVVNQKGGAGKTSTAVTLAAIWAAGGQAVRLVDADPQKAGATLWLMGREPGPGEKTLRGFYFDEHSVDDAAVEVLPNLRLIPSDKSLKQVENERPAGGELALRDWLAEAPPAITIIDCPPSLGLLSVSALVAAEELVIPVRASGLDLEGMAELNSTLAVVRKRLNTGLRISAVLVTDALENNLTRDVHASLERDYPDAQVLRIRHSVRTQEAPTRYEPLTSYAPEATTTQDYRRLADLLLPGAVHRG